MNIGYIGLGDMGGALATRLQSRHPIRVYDLNEQAVSALVERGATAAGSVADLGKSCDIVLLCLPTSAHVRTVVLGEHGLAEALTPGSLIIDQTSGDPQLTVELAEELAGAGLTLVDAPVSGGATGALAGTIAIMLGAASAAVDRAREVLQLISSNVIHIGAVGTGHTMKLVNNLVSCSQRLLSLEALALATKKGVDPALAAKVLATGGARNAFFQEQAGRILAGDRSRGFSIGLAHKDLRLACDLAATSGSPAFYGSLTRELYQMAISRFGSDCRVDSIATFVEQIADVELAASTDQ